MKSAAVIVLTVCCALGLSARANAADCIESNPFVQADTLFSQADQSSSDKVRALWDQGTAVMRAHRNDTPGRRCDAEEFNMRRLHALEHGLSIGYKWAGMDAITAADTADNIFTTIMYNIQVRDPLLDVDKDVRLHWEELYNDIIGYRDRLTRDANAERAARTSTKNTSCDAPFSDAMAPDPVTPMFPEQAKSSHAERTVLVKVNVGETGIITGLQIMQSSGNKWIDVATLTAIMQTKFVPKIIYCSPVPGTYTFRVTFDPH